MQKQKKKNKGLPAKSFIYIITLDCYIRNMLSYLVHTSFFDMYIISILKRFHRYKDRSKEVIDILGYMNVYDEERVNYLMQSKFFTKSMMISLFNELTKDCKEYIRLMSMLRKHEALTIKDMLYIYNFRKKFGSNYTIVIKNLIEINELISSLLNKISDYYLKFIIKMLCSKRHSMDINSVKGEAWLIIMDMIDNYNASRSKVPFHNILSYYIKNKKNKMIHEENWNVPEGDSVILVGSYEQDNEVSSDPISILLDKVLKEMKSNDYEELLNQERTNLLDTISGNLPKLFSTLIQLNFGLIDPFNLNEQIEMLTQQNNKEVQNG